MDVAAERETLKERFKAVAVCPGCDRIGVHWRREAQPRPKPPTDGDEVAYRLYVLQMSQMPSIFMFDSKRLRGRREWAFESIRTCLDCGKEWGQV